MILTRRMDLLNRLGAYMLSDESSWQEAKEKASLEARSPFLRCYR